MKYFSIFAFSLLLTLTGQTQGLIETFDGTCQCWVITNHFDNGLVSSKHYENEARKKHGESLQYNTQSQLIRKEQWVNGVLHGTSLAYHPDGNLYLESKFEHGEKVGTWTFWDVDGSVLQKIEYTGKGSDGIYRYYRAGVEYLHQIISEGQLSETVITNQALYDDATEEAAAISK